MKRFSTMLSIGLVICGLTACQTYHESADNIYETAKQIDSAKRTLEHPDNPVIVKKGYYVDTQPIPLRQKPAWLQQMVSVQANKLPLQLVINQLLHKTPITVSYDDTINKQLPISIHYRGTLDGALQTLAAAINYHYVAKAHELSWSAYETRIFDISFMPGSSNYLVGQQQNSLSSNTNNGSSPIGQINDQQYSNLSGIISVWKDLRNTLTHLKSKQGQVIVSESTTSVTVHDHPSNVQAIATYIKQLNRSLNQQVLIKIQVLEVQLDKNFNYGINWDVVANTLGTRFNLLGDLSKATNLTNNSLIMDSGDSTGVSGLQIGKEKGPQTLINALNQQGKVRVVTQPQVITMNNQIASIRITQSIGYVESVSQTTSENFSTNSINPGSITDGFTLYVLPKIHHNKVYMQISSTIANLERLDKVSNAPKQHNSNSLLHNNSQYQAIQVPTLSQKSFNQRSLLTSGSTLIIAGYKRLRDETKDASFFGIPPLGGKGAHRNNIETLVLITPIILHSHNKHVDSNA